MVDMLGTMGRVLVHAFDDDLTRTFEAEARRLLAARQVSLREVSGRAPLRHGLPVCTADSVAFAVPLRDAQSHAVLQVQLEAGRAVCQESVAAVGSLVPLAALVLTASRSLPCRDRVDEEGVGLVGSSAAMAALRDRIDRVSTTDFTVLIQGESGTGKELVARQLHERSRRRKGPFVAVNCAAIVDTLLEAELFGIEERTATGVRGRRGKFEHAHGGTLFLDEIGDLSLAAQAKLLRAIQDLSVERVGTTGTRRVDIRVVAATNRSLVEMCRTREFRPDLYYRLSGVEIFVPPLRERREDLRELVDHFLHRHRLRHTPTVADSVMDALMLYSWPGNVRELERLVERALALTEGGQIELDDLPPQVRGEYAAVIGPAVAAGDTLRAWGSRYARLVYERCGQNKRRTCQLLDISYHTLRAYLRYDRPGAAPSTGRLPAWVRSMSADSEDGG
jgi:transcriptional regulator with PAS, ATPase and Fis domain